MWCGCRIGSNPCTGRGASQSRAEPSTRLSAAAETASSPIFRGSFEPLGSAPRSCTPDTDTTRPSEGRLQLAVISSAFPPSAATTTRTMTDPHHVTVGRGLLAHVFRADLDTCPRCGGPMRWVEVALTQPSIARLLAEHGVGPRPPPHVPRPSSGQLPL